ncbi:hypothetical protein POTOM_030994 [Populus tomentosa]|uniref:Uncharacterized protein n=1 Tax=Populus tomentosa TaxID=118781 RepID=A0A8X7Z1T0_POPTO|nr:hypothetical protein POTOM_030994 [Populus tomentosa]
MGKLSVEGRIPNKFDTRPHSANLEMRTMEKSSVKGQTKGVINSRQIKVIDNDIGKSYEAYAMDDYFWIRWTVNSINMLVNVFHLALCGGTFLF